MPWTHQRPAAFGNRYGERMRGARSAACGAFNRLRAADALEKLTRTLPGVCDGWEAPLLGLLAETEQIKLRWSLALIVPRLKLTGPECRRTAEVLRSFLGDRSSIVKTCALQGLTDLSSQDASLLAEVVDLLRIHSRSGTAAMRARGRQLLKRLDAQPVSFPLRHGSDK